MQHTRAPLCGCCRDQIVRRWDTTPSTEFARGSDRSLPGSACYGGGRERRQRAGEVVERVLVARTRKQLQRDDGAHHEQIGPSGRNPAREHV